MARKKTNKEFLEELNLKNPDIIPLEEYKGMHEKLLFKCKNGHNWMATPTNIFAGRNCPYCSGKKQLTNDEFLVKLYNITNRYTPLEEYISTHKKILCKCNICGHKWKIEPAKLLSGRGCPECAKKIKRNKGNFKYSKDYILDLLKDKNIVLLDEYNGVNVRNNFKCIKCGYEFTTSISHILHDNSGCKNCLHESLKLTQDEFITKVNKILPEIDIISKYNGSSKRVRYKCKTCGLIHSAYASNLLRGYGCPNCSASKGEKRCKKYLDENKIIYITQYEFDGLVGINGGNLKFDFAIFDKFNDILCLLEYDGIFHYEKQYYNDGFETIRIHDKRKNEYCISHNIPLIRIPYWEYENIEKILDNYFNIGDLTYIINSESQNDSLLLCSNE